MNKLFLEKIKILQTNSISYEFVFEFNEDKTVFRGIDDNYQYPFRALATEFFNLIDNQLYSNKLFNEWKIKLFKEDSRSETNVVKSMDNFLFFSLKNDLNGNIIFHIKDKSNSTLYYRKVKLKDFELFIYNLTEFNEQTYEKYNYYSVDTFFN